MRSCDGRVLGIVSLLTWIKLGKETGCIVPVAIVVASLAALSARLFAGIAHWPGIYWIKMEDDMELMELWIEKVWGSDEVRAWHKDLLSVKKSMEIEGWLTLVEVHDSCFLPIGTGKRSSFGFDGGNHFRLQWGFSSDNCCCTPISCHYISGPSVYRT